MRLLFLWYWETSGFIHIKKKSKMWLQLCCIFTNNKTITIISELTVFGTLYKFSFSPNMIVPKYLYHTYIKRMHNNKKKYWKVQQITAKPNSYKKTNTANNGPDSLIELMLKMLWFKCAQTPHATSLAIPYVLQVKYTTCIKNLHIVVTNNLTTTQRSW